MKLPLSLLKNYVDLEGLCIDKISTLLTLAGLEVEQMENITPSFKGVISAKIETVSPLPKTKKLQLVSVTDGKNSYKLICAAPNCKKDMIVAFAPIGSKVQEITLEEKTIHNIKSQGMLCSTKELNLSENSLRILELPDMELGKDLSYLSDPIFDISLTPNLGHCTSAIGVARELSALLNKKLTYPKISENALKQEKIEVEIKDKKNCKRYSCMIIDNIEIKKSPFWLSSYLEGSGIKSINNVVDTLNFVMLETSQPLHAFDYEKIEDKIVITSLNQEEEFLALDGSVKNLPKDTLVIKDSKKTLAVAGIIGGENSRVTTNTKKIIVESANFHFLPIRKTSRAIGVRSESSIRFEKGVDIEQTTKALKRVAYLLQQESDIIPSIIVDVYENKQKPKEIILRISRTNKILGIKLSLSEIEDILKRLEFIVKKQSDDSLTIISPLFRHDIKKEIDLIEEVARIYGYSNIEKKKPLFKTSDIAFSPLYLFEKKLKKLFPLLGFQEIITCDLISEELVFRLDETSIPKNSIIKVLHAKSKDQSILRPSFLPSFLQVVKHNHYNKNFDISFFEVGRIHFKKEDSFLEQPTSSIILSGKSSPTYFDPKPKDIDFFDLKASLENLFSYLHIKNIKYKKSTHHSFHPGRQSAMYLDDIEIGVLGELHPNLLKKFDIKKPVYFAEISNKFLMDNKKDKIKFKVFSKFPSSSMDLTVAVKKDIEIGIFFDAIEQEKTSILENFFLLDIYNLKDKKNITFRFVYRDMKKTISSEEVEKEHEKIVKKITSLAKSYNNS